jgi:AcrR family transcriptional regulator
MVASPDSDFTVGEVAEHAGISLKTLYRWFDSKDQLVLALLAEECRLGAVLLRELLEPYPSPAERLARCPEAVLGLAELAPSYARSLYRQHQRLSVDHGATVADALEPMVGVVEEEIRRALAVGEADPGEPRAAARVVFALLVDALSAFTVGARARPETVTAVTQFVNRGLGLRVAVPTRGAVSTSGAV